MASAASPASRSAHRGGAAASATALIASTVALARPRTTVTSSASYAASVRCASSASAAATPDRALGLAEAVEVVAVAVVEVAVERLLLGQPLGGVVADGGADVAEHRRRLAAGLRGARLDVAPRRRRRTPASSS